MWTLVTTVFLCRVVGGNYPVFDYTTRMRILLLPADVRPGSVIYRLKGTDADYDYPLRFDVADEVGKSIIRVENMPCTPTHTYCQANVFLLKRLDPDRVYDLILSLKDTTGRVTKVDSTIKATRATSHFEDIFPYVPSVIMVPENTKIGSSLDYVLARKNPQNTRHAYLELWGSEKFRIVQNLSIRDLTNGTITLTGFLDFEEKSMYMLHIFALDPYTDAREDTRNIAGFNLAVIVQDEQDMPPVFNALPAVTKLKGKLKVGDKILKVTAQDGDRGNPREIRYGLVSEKNPFTTFFNISEKSGEIILAKPIKELMAIVRSHQPIVLTVMAEEIKTNVWEPPALTATAQVALLLEDSFLNSPPYFENQQFVTRISENAPQGTALIFGNPHSTLVKDDDMGKDGVFSLALENNNGTFEISPTVGERRANFIIRVRNNAMLDFEKRTSVIFKITAKELTPSSGSTLLVSKANVTVYIEDQNDNPPVFSQSRYEAVLPENVTAGTTVTQVQATDADTGIFGKIFYTNILGNINHSLTIDSVSGIITVATNHGFDRESAAEHRLIVEARDMEGVGNRATVPLIIKLLDVNDETPEFERQVFEFILQPNLRNFTSRAFVKAIDRDAEEPNNVVRYEIMSGNYENKFFLNEVSGELSIRGKLSSRRRNRSERLVKRQSDYPDDYYNQRPQGRDGSGEEDKIDSVIVLTVRAYDLGIPHRWQHAHVRIYPPESRARNMNFIVSGSNPDRRKVEELLKQVTGGRVIIQEIKPYTGQEVGTDLSWKESNSQTDKSVVVATIFYDGNSVVDLNQLETRLTANKTQSIVEATVMEYKNENRLLFWILMFLLILLIIIIVICVLCCIWQGCCVCPWMVIDRKRVVSPSENVKLLLRERGGGHETKGVQAVSYSGRKEAWSGRDNDRTYHYSKRNGREKIIRQMNVENADMPAAAAAKLHRSRLEEEENIGPNVIYTREFLKKEKERQPTMLVEDVEIDPYNTIGKKVEEFKKDSEGKLCVVENDVDSDSMRRHEVERGSDLGKSLRKSDFERLENQKTEDNINYQRIEIDRGLEVGPRGVKEYRLVLERPKRALEDMSDEEILELNPEESNREQYYIRDGNAEILRLVTRGNQDERPRTLVQDNDKTYVKLDKGKDIIMKRFIEDQKQSINENTDEFHQELLRRLQKEYEERNVPFQNRPGMSRNQDTNNLQEYITHLLSRSRNDAMFLNELIQNYDMDNRTVNFSFPNQETQSLPGQIEISTQTEREFGTQTEELSMLRPPRRKVRSDNEFSDDDIDDGKYHFEKAVTALNLGHGWVKRNTKHLKSKKNRRHKIKTPILEEGESANESGIKYDTRPAMFKMPEYELIINGTGPGAYTENKSSILRRRKMKEKILEEAAKSDDDLFLEMRKNDKDDDSSAEESIIEMPRARARKSRRDYLEDKKLSPKKVAKINAVRKKRAESLNRLYKAVRELEDQELETIRLEARQRTASLNRLYNALRELEEAEKTENELKKTRSLGNLNKDRVNNERKRSFHSLDDENDRDYLRRAGFYKRIKDLSSTTTESSQSKQQESTETSWEELRNKRNAKTSVTESRRKLSSEKNHDSERYRVRETVSEPPKSSKDLNQSVSSFGSAEDINKVKAKRSKYMDWYKDLNEKKIRKKPEESKKKVGKKEDDLDSGIAMSTMLGRKNTGKTMIPVKKKNQQMLEKKSVFTIAYDEMQTKNIRPDTNSSQKI